MLCQAVLTIAGLCALTAQAATSLSHTRLVLSPGQPEVSPRVMNEGKQPVLLQLWFDTGTRDADPRAIVVPFVVVPPVLRLEPGATKRLRIMYTGHASPPADRESVYWLNVLEIPPKTGQADADRLQISFRTRVKVFFRPASLRVAPHPHEALQFELRRQGERQTLRITNPTPIHQTLLDLAIGQGGAGAPAQALQPPDMLEPGASIELPIVPVRDGRTRAVRVTYSVIDDYGAVVEGARELAGSSQPASW